jgi:hypothetical protein
MIMEKKRLSDGIWQLGNGKILIIAKVWGYPGKRQRVLPKKTALIDAVKLRNDCLDELKIRNMETNTMSEKSDAIMSDRFSHLRGRKCRYVYFANILGTPIVKIGIAVSPEERLKAIQWGNPCHVVLAGWVKCHNPYSLEQYLHILFREKRCRGEWFLLTKAEIEELLNFLKNKKHVSFDDKWWKNYCDAFPNLFDGEPSEIARSLISVAIDESFIIKETKTGALNDIFSN